METLDLKRYQTAKLTEQLTDVLNVGDAIVGVLKSVGWIAGVLLIVSNLAMYLSGTGVWLWAVSAIYLLAVGVLLGGAIGLVQVGRKLLQQTAVVLQLTIGIANQARKDLQKMNAGDAKLPPTQEILRHAYQDVIFPTVAQIVTRSGGIVSRVGLWLFKITIERSVMRWIGSPEQCSPKSVGGNAEQKTLNEVGPVQLNSETLSQEQERLREFMELAAKDRDDTEVLSQAESWLQAATNRVDWFVLRPLQVLFWFVAVASTVPVIIVWWLS